MYNQIDRHSGLHDFIQKQKLPMIHLMRKNLVKQVVSNRNAHKTSHDPLSITADDLFNSVKMFDELNKKWRNHFSGHKKLELYYEDIIGDSIDGFTFVSESVRMQLCEFFGVDDGKRWFCAPTKKKNKNDIWVYLKNRKEVEKRFKGTQYEWMIK
jgi:hypothetical protein